MKFQIISKEELKWIIPLAGLIILYLIGNNIYNHFKTNDIDKKEKQELVDFVEEHNLSIKVDTSNNEDISKISFNVENSEIQEEDEKLQNLVIEETNLPYTEPLPEIPDEEENNSTLYGVDANGNGVRDDLEILAVKQFGHNKDLVESVFAGVRTYDYDMYVAENNLLEDEGVMKEIINNIDRSYNCQSYFYGNSGFYDQSVEAMDSYANNGERQDIIKYIARRLSGVADDFVTNEKNCKTFFEKTKEYNYR